MTDREKVIKGLEQCSSGTCAVSCPYHNKPQCTRSILADALALLKEQDAVVPLTIDDAVSELMDKHYKRLKEQEHGETFTVIDTKTGKEADEYEIALHEDWAKHLCYCDMEGWALENDGTLLLVDECGRFAYADRERFKVVWDA